MTILVSIPTFRCPEDLLLKAVDSVLKQTHKDLLLVVVGDGEDITLRQRDSRLVLFPTPVNRGRYYCDAVVQEAARGLYEWWAPHDSDDWSLPERFDDLWSRREHGVVWSRQVWHRSNGRSETRAFPRAARPLTDKPLNIVHWAGLYRLDRIHEIGGSHPDFRLHYDTLMTKLLVMTGPVHISPRPLYHRYKRPGSLTKAKETGMRSAMRAEQIRRVDELYAEAYRLYRNGDINHFRLRDLIRSTMFPSSVASVAASAERLRKEIS